MKNSKTIFLTLKVFQATGGIEKVCRIVGKALYEDSVLNKKKLQILSMYDDTNQADGNLYFPSEIFRGYGKNKLQFVLSSIWNARSSDTIIMSHINLLIIGWVIKLLFQRKKLILIAHGIEVWDKLPWYRRKMLMACNVISSVSEFTKNKIIQLNKIDTNKNSVLNNCIDPFLPTGKEFSRIGQLRTELGLTDEDFVIFTLTRLASRERYKGYDQVINCLPNLINKYPNIKYIIGGSYDVEEKKYVDELAAKLHVSEKIILTGFIPENELAAYFKMADLYVMPSMKEGFGIVFVEAMFYGLPVIAGNKDGSVDALLKGELGILVDPENQDALVSSIATIINDRSKYTPDKLKLMEHFGYDVYKKKLERCYGIK